MAEHVLPHPAGRRGPHTHPQTLQVTSEARAFHVNERLGENQKGNVRH